MTVVQALFISEKKKAALRRLLRQKGFRKYQKLMKVYTMVASHDPGAEKVLMNLRNENKEELKKIEKIEKLLGIKK